MDPEVREGLASAAGWADARSASLAIVVGCFAILLPAVASAGRRSSSAGILVIAGAFLVAAAFTAHSSAACRAAALGAR